MSIRRSTNSDNSVYTKNRSRKRQNTKILTSVITPMDWTVEQELQLLHDEATLQQLFENERAMLFQHFNIPSHMNPTLIMRDSDDVSDTATGNATVKKIWINRNAMRHFINNFGDPMLQETIRHELSHIIREYKRNPEMFDLKHLMELKQAKSWDKTRYFKLKEKYEMELGKDKTWGHDITWINITEESGLVDVREEYAHIYTLND